MKHFLRLSAAFLTLLASTASAQSVEGTYKCTGSAPSGGANYSGEVTVKKNGDHHVVTWSLGNAGSYVGSGLVNGNVFAVAYGGGRPYGLVVYKVSGGKLSGSWLVGGSGKPVTGEETIEGAEGLSGTYKITSGKSSQGSSYSGEVTIKKTGETYAVNWALKNESYTGVGILHGDLLVIGWGTGTGYGVVSYDIADGKLGSTLEGKWTAAGSDAVGKETLTK